MAEQPVQEQEEQVNPTMDKIVTALCDRVNRLQIDFAQMCKFHNETMSKMDELGKKVDQMIPERVVQPPSSQHEQQKANPVPVLNQPPGEEAPTLELRPQVQQAMGEAMEPHPFQRPPRKIRGLRPVPADVGSLDLPYVEGLPERTLKQALEGQYVQIDHFLENVIYDIEGEGALEVVAGDEGLVACRRSRGRRGVYNIISWLEAFENYIRIMANYHGIALFNSMSSYKGTIVDYDRMYQWKAVQKFDMKHRSKIGGRSVEFHQIDILTAGLILNNTVMKIDAARCTVCGDYKHGYNACPFRDAPGTQSRSASRRTSSLVQETHRNTNEICFNWNSERCHDKYCWRIHVCRGCGGDLPYKQCSDRGPCNKGQGNGSRPPAHAQRNAPQYYNPARHQ